MRELNDKEVVSMYRVIGNLNKVASHFHVTKERIKGILTSNGVEIKRQGNRKTVSNETILLMIADYEMNHMTIEEISEKHGVYVKKLRRIFDEHGISVGKWKFHEKKPCNKKTENSSKTQKPNKETKQCPYCEWKTYDIYNKSYAYAKHICGHHSVSVREHVKAYPDDSPFFERYNDKHEMVQCKICGKYRKIIDNRHLLKHGITLMEYKSSYENADVISLKCKEKLHKCWENMNNNQEWDRFSSSYERDICEFLEANGIKYHQHDKKILGGNEIDIVLDDHMIGIEFNGLLWHTEWFGKKGQNYHRDKTERCKENGYRLIQIFEDEYVLHKDIVLGKILHIAGVSNPVGKIMGRKCSIDRITACEAETFLSKNHIQGFAQSTVYVGCKHEGQIVGVMTFKKIADGKWDLNRFATDNRYICQGIGGKMFKWFVNEYKPSYVKSFADRRWTLDECDNVYTRLGFKLECVTKPSYCYYYKGDNKPLRFHKFGFRKQILHKKYGFPLSMTETEMVKELGYDRVWDCGLLKYVWRDN